MNLLQKFSISLMLAFPLTGYSATYYCPEPKNVESVLIKSAAEQAWVLPTNYYYEGLTFVKSYFYDYSGEKPNLVPNYLQVIIHGSYQGAAAFAECKYGGATLATGSAYAYLPTNNCSVAQNFPATGGCQGAPDQCKITCSG